MRTGNWLIGLACILFSTMTFAAVPELPRFRVIGAAQGLPSSGIHGLARDRRGYLWLATSDGLARYDGLGFRVWRRSDDPSRGLPANWVETVHVDDADRVWCATEGGGLSMLDAKRERFTHYRRSTHPQMGSDDVFAITSRGGDVWFGTYGGGLHRLDAQGRITRYANDPQRDDSLPSDNIISLDFDRSGQLWVATDAGLAMWKAGRIARIALPDASAHRLFSVKADDDLLWLGTDAGVFVRERGGRWWSPRWSQAFIAPNPMTALVRDHDGSVWIAGYRMLAHGDARGDARSVQLLPGMEQSPQAIFALLAQPDGGIWVPIPGHGLGYLHSDWRRVSALSKNNSLLASDNYTCLGNAARGGIWLMGNAGIAEHVDTHNGTASRLPMPAVTGWRCNSILDLGDDGVWIGGGRHLLRWRDADTSPQTWTPDSEQPLLSGAAIMMRATRDRKAVWIALLGAGLQLRDARTGAVLRTLQAGDGSGLENADIEWIDIDADDTLWVANAEGLMRLQGDVLVHPEGLPHSRIAAFSFDAQGRLWLQQSGGVSRHVAAGSGWRRDKHYGSETGLPDSDAAGLEIDAQGRVWIATKRGLWRIDPQRDAVRRFGLAQGLPSQEFTNRMLSLTDDGVLALGSDDGTVSLLDTTSQDAPRQPLTLQMDAINVMRDSTSIALPTTGGFSLQPGDRELHVRPRLLLYDAPDAVRYQSRLEGIERDWVAHADNGERVFSSLVPGNYRLLLRAIDDRGVVSTAAPLQFRMLPPWWKTPWAVVLFALLLMVALVSWMRAWRDRVRRRHAWQLAERERALAEQASLAKTRFLATLGHEVRTPMTGVLGMSELLLSTDLAPEQRGQVESIRRAGDHLLRLVNDALDLSRIEAGKLTLAQEDFELAPLINDVAELMRPAAQQKDLKFVVAQAGDVPHWLRGDPLRLRQILLNLLSNAIKFTDSGEVRLEVTALEEGGVRIDVVDTGPGLSTEQRMRLFRRFEQAECERTAARYGGSGLGLAISQELAAAMEGRIDVESELGQGTRFILQLPLPEAQPIAMETAASTSDLPSPMGAPASRMILLVEDDPTVAEVISGLLQAQGHEVHHAAHGLAALMDATARRFDLALLDLDLPVMDGLQLARQLRMQGFAQPLIAVTARADAEAETLVHEAGFDGFLRKPLTGAMLASVIDAVLRDSA